MTTAEHALRLLCTPPAPGRTLDWHAQGMLGYAGWGGVVAEVVWDGDPPMPRLRVTASGESAETTDPAALRLFRPLLARLAKLAEEESGVAFDPYAGLLPFHRPNWTWVRPDIEVTFENSPATQRLSVRCAADASARRTPSPVT